MLSLFTLLQLGNSINKGNIYTIPHDNGSKLCWQKNISIEKTSKNVSSVISDNLGKGGGCQKLDGLALAFRYQYILLIKESNH